MDDLLAAAGLRRADVDRLGEAMRQGDLSDAEVDVYNTYRDSFLAALDWVLNALRQAASPPATERQKTIWSTAAKLRRSTARLSQVQDIAGCRVVVPLLADQDELTGRLTDAHPDWRVIDRRDRPSRGYRAVHVIAAVGGLPVEIQIRTDLQHLWGEVSEACDRVFPGVKYGSGPQEPLQFLETVSSIVALVESMEGRLSEEVLAGQREKLRVLLAEALAMITHDVGDSGQEP